MSTVVPDDAPKPRLCHLKKWQDFNGYGFNLHAEKGKAGQFIGKVDADSPADSAGLKEGDRIVEVNGTNIGNENHQQVVQRVKAVPDEVKLLVVDAATDSYFKEKKVVVRGDLSIVEIREAPSEKGGSVIIGAVATAAAVAVISEPERLAEPEKPAEPAQVAEVSSSFSTTTYVPRICHLKIWPDFSGYGFNLHAEKGKPGQFIGKVDEGSPAAAAGLREGDRIIEVNDSNIGQETHGQVVQRIKQVPNETRMLVLDPEADHYFKENNIVPRGDMPDVLTILCPDSKLDAGDVVTVVAAAAVVNGVSENHIEEKVIEKIEEVTPAENGITDEVHVVEAEQQVQEDVEDAVATFNEENENERNHIYESPDLEPAKEEEDHTATVVAGVAAAATVVAVTSEPEKAPEPAPAFEPYVYKQPEPASPSPPTSPVTIGGITFAPSAAEARSMMKRKADARKSAMSMKDKYDLFQRL